jgi:hypothetical protein
MEMTLEPSERGSHLETRTDHRLCCYQCRRRPCTLFRSRARESAAGREQRRRPTVSVRVRRLEYQDVASSILLRGSGAISFARLANVQDLHRLPGDRVVDGCGLVALQALDRSYRRQPSASEGRPARSGARASGAQGHSSDSSPEKGCSRKVESRLELRAPARVLTAVPISGDGVGPGAPRRRPGPNLKARTLDGAVECQLGLLAFWTKPDEGIARRASANHMSTNEIAAAPASPFAQR